MSGSCIRYKATTEEIVEWEKSGEENQKRNQESRQKVQKQKVTEELARKRAIETMSQKLRLGRGKKGKNCVRLSQVITLNASEKKLLQKESERG